MAYSTIDKPSKYFEPVLYTGNDANNRTINTTENFQADLFWIKSRSTGASHILNDILRSNGYLLSNATSAEGAYSTLSWTNTAPVSTGFKVDLGSNGSINGNGTTFVSWCWKANGTGVSNTSGTISSTVSANTTSGFSIVSYTGNATNGATVGHGLGAVPDMLIGKDLSDGSGWGIWHKNLSGATYRLSFSTDAESNDSFLFGGSGAVLPTSTVFTLGSGGGLNGANANIVYCFRSIKGYSKFGSYTGNNSLNNFVYTGFKPAFVMVKVTSTTEQWCIKDNKRNTYNVLDRQLFANASNAEDYNTTNHLIDFVSNGFNLKDNTSQNLTNGSGQTYIYMAFAESPFVSSKGVCTTAR